MKYPNLDLYGNLKACEDNLLEMINSNFFKLDSAWMVRAIDLVSELPSVASFGDIYILESGVYDHTYSIEIFDGVSWQSIEVKNGMHFWIESEKDFFYLEDGVLKTFADTYGDVTGPNYSLNNSIARFDGNTGKFITDSNVTIDDNNNVFGIADIYSEASYSYHSEFNFSYSENLITENLTTNSILGKTTNATLNVDTIETSSIFNELDSSFALAEIENISHSKNQASNLFLITNKSGDSVFLNKDGNIEYSKDGDLEILNGDTAFILYDLAFNKYRVITTSSNDASGIGGVDILFVDTFEKAKIEDYTTTGIVSLDKVNPIHGLVSMKLEHPNSGYSQYAKTYDVPKAFEGSAMRFKLTVKTNADTDIGSLTINSIYNGDTTHILLNDVKLYDGENVFLLQFPNEEGSFYYNVRAFDEVGNPVTIIDDVVLEKDLGYHTAKDLNVEGSSILMGEIVTGGVHEDESIGEDVILSDLEGHIIELTDSGLVSIAGISHAQDFTNYKIWNKTGNVVVFKHDSSDAVGREKIFTNSKMPFYLEDNAILEVVTSEDGNIITTKDSPYVQYEQGDENDWEVVARGNAGQSITANVTDIPFIPVSNNTEGGITFNGTQFSVSEEGEYDLDVSVRYAASVAGSLSLIEDGSFLANIGGSIGQVTKGGSLSIILSPEKTYTIRQQEAGGTLQNNIVHQLIITRRQMKLKGSVDVTPFVELPEMPVTQAEILTNVGDLGQTSDLSTFVTLNASGEGLYTKSSAGLTFLKEANLSVSYFVDRTGGASSTITVIYLNGSPIQSGTATGNGHNSSTPLRVKVGDKITFYGLGSDNANAKVSIVATSTTEAVAVADTGLIGEVIFSGNPSAPKGFIDTDNKTIGLTGDYNSHKYFELYKQIWNFPSLSTVATDAYSISSAKGVSAEADWGAGKLIRVNFTENEVFIRAKGSARDLGSYEADELKSHTHTLHQADGPIAANWDLGVVVGQAPKTPTTTSSSTGGTETRPKNVALNAYVRYSADLQIYVNKMPKRYIVETFSDANGYYEVNNDGWVKMRGRAVSGNTAGNYSVAVTFPIQMNSTLYYPSYNGENATSSAVIWARTFTNLTTTGMTVNTTNIYNVTSPNHTWIVEGYGDSAAVRALGATPNY